MRKLRILVLMHEDLVPPDDPSGADPSEVEWRTEHDVLTTLRKLDHEVLALGLRNELEVIQKAIAEWKPHIAFNLLEEFRGVAAYDQNVVSYLELLGLPYTGCNPWGLMLARHKALSKKILAYHRIAVPEFAVFPMGRAVRRSKRLSFPLIVKSVSQEASLGISQASIVDSDEKLRERVALSTTAWAPTPSSSATSTGASSTWWPWATCGSKSFRYGNSPARPKTCPRGRLGKFKTSPNASIAFSS